MPGKGDGNAFHRGEMGQVRVKEIGSYRDKVPSERSILGASFPRKRYQRQGWKLLTTTRSALPLATEGTQELNELKMMNNKPQIAWIFKSRRNEGNKRKDSFGVYQAQQNFCYFINFCGTIKSAGQKESIRLVEICEICGLKNKSQL